MRAESGILLPSHGVDLGTALDRLDADDATEFLGLIFKIGKCAANQRLALIQGNDLGQGDLKRSLDFRAGLLASQLGRHGVLLLVN
jgi:hypothetical protein